jgi:hypothetical protein
MEANIPDFWIHAEHAGPAGQFFHHAVFDFDARTRLQRATGQPILGSSTGKRYPLANLVLIAVAAMLAGRRMPGKRPRPSPRFATLH